MLCVLLDYVMEWFSVSFNDTATPEIYTYGPALSRHDALPISEHRPGVAPGHIPGSRNLPYARLFHDDGTWKRGPALAAEFRAAGIDVDRSEEHTSELQSLMRTSYAVSSLKTKTQQPNT